MSSCLILIPKTVSMFRLAEYRRVRREQGEDADNEDKIDYNKFIDMLKI